MRLLHTSDWHLGRSFHRVGLLDAQAAFLDHLIEVVRAERVDVVVVSGDVYDRALPSVDVVAVLDDALARLAATGAAIVISSGNHDSARRLGFAARLLESARVHLRTDPDRHAEPVLLADRYGPVAVYPLPYLEPAVVAGRLGCDPGHEPVLRAALQGVRADLAERPPGTRSVLTAHAFVIGGAPSESERDISTGGVGAVPAEVFAGIDYVALGHLHGRQQLTEQVRYAGSPLAYSFSEHAHVKGCWLVELGPAGVERVDAVQAPVPRPLAVLRGRLPDLLSDPALAAREGAWCQITLTDPHRPRDAMQQIRARFPEALELRWEPDGAGRSEQTRTARLAGHDDLQVCCGFVEDVRGRPAEPQEVALLRAALEHGRIREAEQHGAIGLRRPVAAPAPAPIAGDPAAAPVASDRPSQQELSIPGLEQAG